MDAHSVEFWGLAAFAGSKLRRSGRRSEAAHSPMDVAESARGKAKVKNASLPLPV
jgi:hypothetical protein